MIAEHSVIVARGMGVRRGGRWLLRPVTFGVPEGVVGLAGPPGAGKSTLLATFATLRRPNAGVLRILGHDISNTAGLRAARAGVGYLPARFSRAENMTAGEFVSYAAYYKRTSAAAARSVLRRLDLGEAAGTELALLPPDVRLRAGLAAACVHEPELVLLDDPFGELCAAAEPWPTGAAGPGREVLPATLSELVPVLRSLAPTVLVTADATEALTGWCDRLFTLTRGRLTEQPTHSAAARRGRSAADRRGAGPRTAPGLVRVPSPRTVDAGGGRRADHTDGGGPEEHRAAAAPASDPASPSDPAPGPASDPAPAHRPANRAARPGPYRRRPARLTLPQLPRPAMALPHVGLPHVSLPHMAPPRVALPQMAMLRARRPPARSSNGV